MNKAATQVIAKIQHEMHIRNARRGDADMSVTRVIREAFVNRRFSPGKVAFSKSSFSDPHIKLILGEIAKQTNIKPEQIIAEVSHEMEKFAEMANIAPILYSTIKDNIVEDTVFKVFEKHKIQTKGPKFDVTTFYELMRSIQSDHDEFFPLRSFIDQKHLHSPRIVLVGTGHESPAKYGEPIETAAATPNGEFIFNVDFIQRLLDYAHLKQIKPKGRKYVSNGGPVPDEYGYAEFIIIHEFMHYTNDDFYYHKIIPDANNKIINWVGDFRTNYLLVKSGYEQLPMGLFNDKINYDRQVHYVEMYDIVKSEFDKLSKEQKKRMGDKLGKMGDDHRPGNKQGEQSKTAAGGKDAQGNPIDPSKIDEKAKVTEGQMKGSKDSKPGEKPENKPGGPDPGQGAGKGGPGSGADPTPTQIDYSKIKPRFNWAQLIKHFVSNARPRVEETYQKPSRRGVSGLHIAAQVGKSAVKPAEVETELNEVNLGFVVDSSGSMAEAIKKAFANIHQLLKQPAFAKTMFTLIKFSGSHLIYKANFAKNSVAKVESADEKPNNFQPRLNIVFSEHIGNSTNFSAPLVADIEKLAKNKVNILIFSDADILESSNLANLLHVIKTHIRSTFILFDSRDTYLSFRQTTGISTPNISYIE